MAVVLIGTALLNRTTAAEPGLQNDILPLLKLRCVQCHGPNKLEGGLNLSLPPTIARGGESGPVVTPGNPEESLLWNQVSTDEMPPEEPLSSDEKEILRLWIAGGAPGLPEDVPAEPEGDEHWAFQSIRQSEIPVVRDEAGLQTPIDRFIQAKLESVGLSIGAEADRQTLIRRVAFDVTGLSPTLEEIARFVDDKSDDAYEQMVDRYLASPHYGERWGKYWLDAAGYADSNGYFGADTDRPLAYRYRDYVIRSLNNDKPFDRFIREQLAGDELAQYQADSEVTPEIIELLEATHFLRNSPDGTDSSDGNPDEVRADKYAVLEGTLQILGSSLFGITVQCARCHDHKFEPFTQQEYYQLQAVLYSAFPIEKWVKPKQRKTQAITATELAAWRERSAEIDALIAAEREPFFSWVRENREPGELLFDADFNGADQRLAAAWSNAAPGDTATAGQPGVNIDSAKAPGAQAVDGRLRIVESRDDGDRAFSTREKFDWTPENKGEWIEVTFDLVADEEPAPYVGYFLALGDFNDSRGVQGGNVLIDGAAKGGATVHVDYPGQDAVARGNIGKSGYVPNGNYGVRVTNVGDSKYELAQVVGGILEEKTVVLEAADLPDGGFGFEYCCGRSFTVDNVRIAKSDSSSTGEKQRQAYAKLYEARKKEYDAAVAKLESERGEEPGFIASVRDVVSEAPEVFLLERGSYKTPGKKVEAAAPAMVSEADNPTAFNTGNLETPGSTGHRLALARWLTKPDSRAAALLARVTVNRWWRHHFGSGIVSTPENLGYSGSHPSHRELLDYLAAKFENGQWSAKAVHREILCSAVYRQSSATNTKAEQLNPDNALLWRFPLRRLDAEAIRDAMLAVSGELDRQRGGPYIATERTADGDVVVPEQTAGAGRRSVYLQQRRTQVLGMLEVFDAPSIVFNCTARQQTTVPLQSLKLLNSEFVRKCSAAFSRRLTTEVGEDAESRIRHAFLLCTGQEPSSWQLESAVRFIEAQTAEYTEGSAEIGLAWVDFCQSLLSSNAFLYVK